VLNVLIMSPLKRITLRHMDAGRKVVTETEYPR
jgi:hypothetical protein